MPAASKAAPYNIERGSSRLVRLGCLFASGRRFRRLHVGEMNAGLLKYFLNLEDRGYAKLIRAARLVGKRENPIGPSKTTCTGPST